MGAFVFYRVIFLILSFSWLAAPLVHAQQPSLDIRLQRLRLLYQRSLVTYQKQGARAFVAEVKPLAPLSNGESQYLLTLLKGRALPLMRPISQGFELSEAASGYRVKVEFSAQSSSVKINGRIFEYRNGESLKEGLARLQPLLWAERVGQNKFPGLRWPQWIGEAHAKSSNYLIPLLAGGVIFMLLRHFFGEKPPAPEAPTISPTPSDRGHLGVTPLVLSPSSPSPAWAESKKILTQTLPELLKKRKQGDALAFSEEFNEHLSRVLNLREDARHEPGSKEALTLDDFPEDYPDLQKRASMNYFNSALTQTQHGVGGLDMGLVTTSQFIDNMRKIDIYTSFPALMARAEQEFPRTAHCLREKITSDFGEYEKLKESSEKFQADQAALDYYQGILQNKKATILERLTGSGHEGEAAPSGSGVDCASLEENSRSGAPLPELLQKTGAQEISLLSRIHSSAKKATQKHERDWKDPSPPVSGLRCARQMSRIFRDAGIPYQVEGKEPKEFPNIDRVKDFYTYLTKKAVYKWVEWDPKVHGPPPQGAVALTRRQDKIYRGNPDLSTRRDRWRTRSHIGAVGEGQIIYNNSGNAGRVVGQTQESDSWVHSEFMVYLVPEADLPAVSGEVI